MVQMVFALGIPLPAENYSHEVEPPQEQVDVVGDLTNQLDLFVLVERPQETLREQLPPGLSQIEQDSSGYPIQFLQKWGVTPLLFPLDNVPTGDSFQKTSLSEARATLLGFWRECKFVPLDVFSFAEVVHAKDGGYPEFLERLKKQYQPYFHTVIILFADSVRLGEEEYHVVLRIDEGCQRVALTAYSGDKTFDLAAMQREAILMACVPVEAVILNPRFVRPQQIPSMITTSQALPLTPGVSLADVVDYENDPRYTLRFSEWTNSGLTRDEFVQQRGADAYVLVDTSGIK
jgi:hypothetical protein